MSFPVHVGVMMSEQMVNDLNEIAAQCEKDYPGLKVSRADVIRAACTYLIIEVESGIAYVGRKNELQKGEGS